MVLVDGKKIAEEIFAELRIATQAIPEPLSLLVLACDPNFETRRYMSLKQKKAKLVGINLEISILPSATTTAEVVEAIQKALPDHTGIIVQLPFPEAVDMSVVLSAIPASHDVDAFGFQFGRTATLPPVVGAVALISRKHKVEWSGKKVVVFGQGRLVGGPASVYAKEQGGDVMVVNETTLDISLKTKEADIIVLGAGKPGILTSSMVKAGVVVFDAGASEDDGVLVGDADPAVLEKASLFTPVPGGIGPITVALLFANLVTLYKNR